MERVRIWPTGTPAIAKINQPDLGSENGELKPKISSRQRNKSLRLEFLGIESIRCGIPQIEIVPLKSLKRSFLNARTHSKAQVRQIANSVREFGWTGPILTDEHRHVIAGGGRQEAAMLLGLETVPIIAISGLSQAEKRALALADNKIAANAGWDRAIPAEELGELALLLPECDLKIEITGFEPAEIDALMGDLADPEHDPADEILAPSHQAITVSGDLWKLGNHRLKCGNSLVVADVRQLMGANRASMVIADPLTTRKEHFCAVAQYVKFGANLVLRPDHNAVKMEAIAPDWKTHRALGLWLLASNDRSAHRIEDCNQSRHKQHWFSGLNDELVRNDLDTIQVARQFAYPLARRVGICALGRLLKFGADVRDALESKGAPGTPHLVPQKLHGLKVNPIQGVQHRDPILPAVLQIRGDPVS